MHLGRREGLNVPVTNLKGLVTRSSSDILAVVRCATELAREDVLKSDAEGLTSKSLVGEDGAAD